MKKIAITNLLILFTFLTQAQISVNNEPDPVLIGKVGTYVKCHKKGDWYTFTFKDIKYQMIDEYSSFSFKDEDDAFNQLFTIIKNGLENPPEDDIEIDVPGGQLTLMFVKSFGVGNVQFYYYENGVGATSAYMTQRKVDKLFGKR